MKKTFTILIAAIAAILMMAQPGKVVGQVSTATATNGGSYVVAYYANNKYYALPHGTSASEWSGTEVTLNSINKVNTSTAASLAWTLTEGTTSGQYYLTYTSDNNTYYLYKNGGTSNTNYNIKGTTSTSERHYWKFTLNSGNNDYTVEALKSNIGNTKYLGQSSSNYKFGVYSSTTGIILLEIGDATPCTVTLADDNTQMTEASAGAGVTLPSRNDVSPYTFAGWSTTNCGNEETTTAPASIIPAGTYHPTANVTLYPVYTRIDGGSITTEWHLTDLDDVDEGVYALLSSGNKAFNGTIESGHGQSTSNAFSFTDGVATSAPTGLCELTLINVTGGFKMYNSSYGYLYGSAASAGNLAWHETETSYWSYTSSNWIYTTNTVYLRSYNDTFRTYGKASNSEIKFAKKITTGTTYYISVISTGTPSISASNVEILYSATGGSIAYNINDEPDPAGTLSAAIKAGTTSSITNLTFGDITDAEVPFTCDANNAFSAHTATVTLTYTYGEEESVTKDITITQAAAPIVLSYITLSGTYPTVFIQDDAFSSTGIVVTAHYNDESSLDVTNNATFSGYDMSTTGEQTVTVSYTESGVTKTANYTITVNEIPNKTIAQFISAGGGKCYLTGTVSNIANTTYGNFDLTDESGTIYVYGCLNSSGQSGQFASLGIVANDVIKVIANEYIYFNNTTHEAKNVKFVEEIVPNPQTLTVNATNGSVEITGKTLDNGSCEVNEGASVTATATPANHYTFTSWTAEGVTLADATANPLTFTMPTNDVTLTASFTENAKHNATFYVLGGISGTDSNVYEGDAITFPSVTAPNGYTFMGWTTSSIVGIQDDAPNVLVNSANMGNANIDYYAVFAIQTGGDEGTVELTNSAITNYKSNSTTSYRDDYSINNWTGRYLVNNSGNTYYLQLGYNASTSAGAYNSHLTTPLCANNITSITISTNKGTSSGRTFYLCSASNLGTASSTNATYGYGSTTEADGSVTINVTGNTKQFHIYPNGTAYIASVTLTYSNVSYSSYCTTVNALDDNILPLNQSFELKYNFTITTGTYYLDTYVIVPDGITLTVDGTLGNSDPDFLVIEDGGQLICSNSVAATVKKSIANANAKDPKNHWYTISAPVHTGSNNYVTIGASTTVNLTNNGAYDMFAYDEPTHYWLNQKSGSGATGFDKMYAGQGYMYRNSGNELSYVGNTTVGPVNIALSYTSTLDVEGLKGFNLIGNPYTHSITKGTDAAIDNANLATGFYTLNNSGSWKPQCENGSEIKPNQGILVEATAAVADFQIKDINYTPSKYNNDNIQFIVANNEYEDVTYAWFGKGYGLKKINHRNADIPMLYIPQDDNNYAIATMSDNVKVFGLNFKAATMGQYTLSYKATGEYNYIHVIDRLTGEDVDMLLEDKYTFVATPNDQENRFIVKLGYTPDYSEGDNDIFVYQTGSEILVSGEGELQIFDVTGRKVMTTTINGAESVSVPAQGVYIFRLVGNEIKTQKIVVR